MMYELTWLGTGMLAAVCTYWLHTRFALNPVMASGIVTLAIALAIPLLDGSPEWLRPIPYAGIGGSFIGMSTRKTMKGVESVMLASLIFGLIFMNSSQFFEGFGGALGTSACISVLTATTWRKFAKKTRYSTRRVISRVWKF